MGEVSIPSKTTLGSCVPSEVCLFVSEATCGSIVTMDELKRRGWFLIGFVVCVKNENELVDLLLIHYGIARGLWYLLLSSLGFLWVLLFSC